MHEEQLRSVVDLICKECGKVFRCESIILLERAGKVFCAHCGKTGLYDVGEIKKD